MKQLKFPDGSWWCFSCVAVMNMAVGVMLYVVTLPPPLTPQTVRLADVRHHQPLQDRINQGTPAHITIPSLGLDVDVATGRYNVATTGWAATNTQAYYALPSVPINDHNGTTLIYGHAQSLVFARLPEIQHGAQAVVVTSSGQHFYYSYVSMKQVLPADTSVFTDSGEPRLVLQTCMGEWDTYRGLFTFHLEKVQRSV